MTKEQAYDSHVSPLMAQIIALCKEHQIPMLANFTLDAEEGLQCTTSLLLDEWEPSAAMLEAYQCLCPRRSPLMVTTRNGDGEITSVEAIL